MRRIMFIVLVSLLFLFGCTQVNFVVLRDVPVHPSFTVIPFNSQHEQIQYSNEIEETLTSCSVKVVKFITFQVKEVTEQQGINADQKGIAGIGSGLGIGLGVANKRTTAAVETMRTEKNVDYGNIKSDYIVFTDSSCERIQIINKETTEILATFLAQRKSNKERSLLSEPENNLRKVIHDALKKMGIDVKEPPKE